MIRSVISAATFSIFLKQPLSAVVRVALLCLVLFMAELNGPVIAEESAAATPWDAGPLVASGEELRKAAQEASEGVEAGTAAVILYEGQTLDFDEGGRLTRKSHRIYRILDPAGVDGWGSMSVTWDPWHQRTPFIGARVIGPDGREHQLDPATVVEESIPSEDPEILTDQKRLRAPLPGVAVGATVEEWSEVVDEEPLFAAGVVQRVNMGHWVPMLDRHIRVSAPKDLPVRWSADAVGGLEPKVRKADGRKLWEFRPGPGEPIKELEDYLPGDIGLWPRLTISTAKSWQAVAESYGEVVDKALEGEDLSAQAAEAVGDATSRQRMAERLLAWVHDNVRYTGLELGEAALFPRAPSETLTRGYGDCKDKATLVVGLLRQVGIDARVVLLRTGYGRDVDPSTPGFGAFNHAIVVMPGDPELWIDATAVHARVGELPFPDQDRMALVTGPGARELVRTPMDSPADNLTVEERQVALNPRLGKGSMVEKGLISGASERELRGSYAVIEARQIQDEVKTNMSEQMGVGTVSKLTWSDPADLSAPFEFNLEAEDVAWALTDLTDAAVARNLNDLFDDLPQTLFEFDEETPREHDLLLLPYRHESRQHVVPPLGYLPLEQPETKTVEIGAGKFEQSWKLNDDGSLDLELIFDTGPARWTAEQVNQARGALKELLESSVWLLELRHAGEQALVAGDLAAALEIYRSHRQAEPELALHRARLARGLLNAGLGLRARQEARAAVEMEPDSDIAHQFLGLVLDHDEIGRMHRSGFDRQGSAAAYRKAIELDPENPVHRLRLSALLSFNDDGNWLGEGADLEGALEQLEAMEGLETDPADLARRRLELLYRMGRFEEVRDLYEATKEVAEDQGVRGWHTGAIAVLEGTEKAAAARAGDADATQILATAAYQLLAHREYGLAADLAQLASSGQSNAAQLLVFVDVLRRSQRHEEMELDLSNPEHWARRVMETLLKGGFDGLLELAGTRMTEELQGLSEEEREQLELIIQSHMDRQLLSDTGIDAALDLAIAQVQVKVSDDGTGNGMRVEAGIPGSGELPVVAYLVREKGRLVLLSLARQGTLIADHALSLVADGRYDIARTWLGWAHDDLTIDSPDPFVGHASQPLWKGAKGFGEPMEGLSEADYLSFIAQLFKAVDGKQDAVDELREKWLSVEQQDAKRAVQMAVVASFFPVSQLEKEQAELALEMTATWLDEEPDSQFTLALRAMAWAALGEAEKAYELGRAMLEEKPKRAFTYDFMHMAAVQSSDLNKIFELLDAKESASLSVATDFNNYAWYLLFTDQPDLDRALAMAQRGAQMDKYENAASLHTLATILAEKDRPSEALKVLMQSVEMAGVEEPRSHDWYVFGRIAESLGEPQAAVELYQRVVETEDSEDDPEAFATSTLAKRRIAGLAKADSI